MDDEEKRGIGFQEYIPSDSYALQDMYLGRIDRLGNHFRGLMKAYYNGTLSVGAVIEFYADAVELFEFAKENVRTHLTEADFKELDGLLSGKVVGQTDKEKVVRDARRVFEILQKFAWDSQLTKLSATRVLGSFAKARAQLGIVKGG